MNIHDIYRPFLVTFRRKRLRIFSRMFNLNSSTKLLDVGGDLFFWELAEKEGIPLPNITIVNLYENTSALPKGVAWIVADGKSLPFDDLEFDIAFCNSVIEHLGDFKSQIEFANEIIRVAHNYFVQTPNKGFPIEPHFITPFVHWLPKAAQKRLVRNFTTWGIVTRPTPEYCAKVIAELRLLGVDEMSQLFPGSSIVTESLLGVPKSIIAVKN